MSVLTRRLLVVLVLLPCSSALALLHGQFRSIGEIAAAENLLIVEAVSPPPGLRFIEERDGVRNHLVKVLKVLNGPQPEDRDATRISTTSELMPGARYLLAGGGATRNGKPWLLFHFDLGVVRIPDSFNLRTLEGKSVKEQVAAILAARRPEAQRELRRLTEENRLLDTALSEKKPSGKAP
jgi:hypothetical protein